LIPFGAAQKPSADAEFAHLPAGRSRSSQR
jgi:hypothetical protein